jgi:hypothetical protein
MTCSTLPMFSMTWLFQKRMTRYRTRRIFLPLLRKLAAVQFVHQLAGRAEAA